MIKHLHIDIDYTSIAIPSSIVREREKILIMAEGSHEQAENPPNRGRAPTCNGSLNKFVGSPTHLIGNKTIN